MSTSIGFGDFIEIPIGFDFCKLHGKLALGPVILSVFGGGAGSWNATLTPLGSFAAEDVAEEGGYAGFTRLEASAPFGYGWLAGAAIGVRIDPVTVNLFAEYRSLIFPLTMTAEYLTGPADGLITPKTLDASAASLRMRGFEVGIGGSFAF